MTFQQVTDIAAGILLAALIPAVLIGVRAGSPQLITLAFVVVLCCAIFVGLPAFIVLKANGKANVFTASVAGFAVGSILAAIFAGPSTFQVNSSIVVVGTEEIPLAVDGAVTAAGWLHYLLWSVQFGVLGAISGLAFWMMVKRSEPHTNRDRSISSFTNSQISPDRGHSSKWVLFITVVVLSIGVLSIPTIMKDRTCHNPLRDGRTSIRPKVQIRLQITEDEWTALKELYREQAARHRLSFRDTSERRPDVVNTLYLSICNDDGVTVSTTEQRWKKRYTHGLGPELDRRVGIWVYLVRDEAQWKPLVLDMLAALNERWPDKVQFVGDRGQLIPTPYDLTTQ